MEDPEFTLKRKNKLLNIALYVGALIASNSFFFLRRMIGGPLDVPTMSKYILNTSASLLASILLTIRLPN